MQDNGLGEGLGEGLKCSDGVSLIAGGFRLITVAFYVLSWALIEHRFPPFGLSFPGSPSLPPIC